MRFILVLLLLFPLISCSADADDAVTGRVLYVQGSDLAVEIDGKQEKMRLAGVIPPKPGDCMHDKFKSSVGYHASDYQDVEVTTVGKAPDGVPLVKVGITSYSDEATDLSVYLVEDGVAVIDAREEDINEAMLAAREKAYEDRAGLLSDYEECTLGAKYGDLDEQFDDVADFNPDDVDGANLIIDDLAAWIVAADSFLHTARGAAHDLRLMAYPPTVLALMLTAVETRRANAKQDVASTKALRKKLGAKEARQRARDKAETDRFWAEWNAEHNAPNGGSSSGSSGGGGHDGYTGPRCYEPGGETYHPC